MTSISTRTSTTIRSIGRDPTGTQEILIDILAKPLIEWIEPVGEGAAKVGDTAPGKPTGPASSGPQKGQYKIETESNKWHVGKGTPKRMQESVRNVEKAGEKVAVAMAKTASQVPRTSALGVGIVGFDREDRISCNMKWVPTRAAALSRGVQRGLSVFRLLGMVPKQLRGAKAHTVSRCA